MAVLGVTAGAAVTLRGALLATLPGPAVPPVPVARAVVVLANRGGALLVVLKKAFGFELRTAPSPELDAAMLVTPGSASILVGRGVRVTLLLPGDVAPGVGDDPDVLRKSSRVGARLLLALFAGGRRDRLVGSVRLPGTVELANLTLVELPNMVKLCTGEAVLTTVAVVASATRTVTVATFPAAVVVDGLNPRQLHADGNAFTAWHGVA